MRSRASAPPSASERLTLIGDLWDSLDDSPLSAAQAAELAQRLAGFEEDAAEGATWDQLKDELADRAP